MTKTKAFLGELLEKIGSNQVAVIIVSVIFFVLIMSAAVFAMKSSDKTTRPEQSTNSSEKKPSKLSSLLGKLDSDKKVSPSPSNTVAPVPSDKPTPTATTGPSKTPTPKPTAKPSSTPTPLPTNTPAPTYTPAPTRTPNPPRTRISFPTNGQVITANEVNHTICIVDVPDGGDFTGATKRTNIDNAGWSAYQGPSTTCPTLTDGSHSIAIQFKNQYGEEGNVASVSYTYKYENPNQCTDTDGGQVFETAGTTAGGSSKLCPENNCATFCPGTSCTDSCGSYINGSLRSTTEGEYVIEWFCNNGGLTYNVRMCDSRRCENGACQPVH
ncbi:MAG: hypothetical protein ACOZAN_03160 [Patescibacteria group bacterium]